MRVDNFMAAARQCDACGPEIVVLTRDTEGGRWICLGCGGTVPDKQGRYAVPVADLSAAGFDPDALPVATFRPMGR